jgi:predicted ATPase
VHEAAQQTVIDALIHALRNRHLLLVIDNCEHLLDVCARLVDDLVRACEHVQVLATSREALGLTEEVTWRVPSLAIPDAAAQFTVEELGANPAVQLFVERAAALMPRFQVTERNASAIAQICRRLDGIPLALELAAARAQALAPEQIAARLDQRFQLLTGGSRAALPRQQTLRATLDWSYDLLSEAERLLLNRLSVFAGSWSLEVAEVVCVDERIPQGDVLDLLAHLVGTSLVAADESADDAKRYRLLDTVRQYARERLVETGETQALHERHAGYFLAFGEPTAVNVELPLVTMVPRPEQFDALEHELDNLRVTMRWWIDSLDVDRAISALVCCFPSGFGEATQRKATRRCRKFWPSRRRLAVPRSGVAYSQSQRAWPCTMGSMSSHSKHSRSWSPHTSLLATTLAQRTHSSSSGTCTWCAPPTQTHGPVWMRLARKASTLVSTTSNLSGATMPAWPRSARVATEWRASWPPKH